VKVVQGSGGTADDAYGLVGVVSTFRVNNNNTTTDLVEITARSVKFGVEYTWDILKATFDGEGAGNAAAEKTAQVNYIAERDHVYAVRSVPDQDKSGVLYNYLVVTVGTDDGSSTVDVLIRMDELDAPASFGALDAAWKNLQDLGAA
jgi:hypothetical protein